MQATALASSPVRMLGPRHRWVSNHEGISEMKLNRKGVTIGLVGLGLVGALTGGVGAAAAATGSPGTSPSAGAAPFAGMSGMGGGMHGMASGQNSPVSGAASYLGLGQTDLQKQLQAGKSLADIAKAQGKSVPGLEDAMVAAVKGNLDANTALTADQKTAILTKVQSRIDTMVNTTHEPGSGIGPMGGGRMNGAMDEMGH